MAISKSARHRLLIVIGVLVAGLLSSLGVAAPSWRAQVAAESHSLPNVILVVVDALRADHVSAYGYSRATTPNLDAWIANPGIVFLDATSSSSWTFPANAAMLTGRSPTRIGVHWSDPQGAIPSEEVMLAEYLHDAGYYTVGFVSSYYAKSYFGFGQGFDTYTELVGNTENSTRACQINQASTQWLNGTWQSISGTQPLFLYLYYFDPHTWYNPPSPYDTLYDADYTGTLTAAVYRDSEDVVSGAISPTVRDVQHLIALYDGEITYWDSCFGEMMQPFTEAHLLDNSVVIVTSDHGEMFGEHGKWTHRNSLYEEALRVPLLMRHTGVVSSSRVVSTPVQTMDIAATILDWAGLPVPANMQGLSLKPLASGEPMTMARDIFSEMDAITDPTNPGYWLAPRYELRSLRQGNWKYIHPVGLEGSDELYWLNADSPYEIDNRLMSEPVVAHRMFQDMVDWFHLLTKRVNMPLITRN